MTNEDLESAREWSIDKPCSLPKEFTDLAKQVMIENNISKPTTPNKAVLL